MPANVNPIPEHLHSLTPNLVCRNAAEAIEFYKKAFGATELMRMAGPRGEVMHAELRIGDTTIFVNDTMSKTGPPLAAPGEPNIMYLHLYVPDADAVFNAAVAAGARADMKPEDMFWGDRYAKVTDPFGQQWGIATRKEVLSQEEMRKRGQEFFAKMAARAGAAS